MKHGDESGVWWIPAPKPERGVKAKIHVVRGPPPESDWCAPNEFPELTGEVAFDVETKDPHIKKMGPGWCFPDKGGGQIVGFSFAWEGGEGYWPIRHEGGGNLDATMTLRWLKAQAEKSDVRFICHNSLYDFGWLRAEKIRPANRPLDTQVAVSLLDEWRGEYDLDSCARDYAGIVKDESLLRLAAGHFGFNPKTELWRLAAPYVGPYGTADAVATWELWKKCKPLLAAENLGRVFELETDVILVCLDMRERGVRVDVDRATTVSKELLKRGEVMSRKIKDLVGFPVDVWANDSLAKAFDKRGVPYPRTEKTDAPSFRKEWLEACPDELGKMVREVRSCEKIRTTFVEGAIATRHANGRIYPQFNPLMSDEGGTVSGRPSCKNPNLLNLPARDAEMGPLVRGLVLPEEDTQWGAGDYSQQEPRLTVHYAALIGAPGAQDAVTQYRTDPDLDFHNYVRDLTGLKRFDAKTLNLAMTYGQGEASTCHKLQLPTEWVHSNRRNQKVEVAGPEGRALIDQYHGRMPFIRFLSDSVKNSASKNGYIYTLFGRRCRFGEKKSFLHTALNRLIQGSAADQTKEAMVQMWREGITPLVQVYDEIGAPIDSDTTAKRMVEIMKDCVELLVPSKVDLALGNNWGEAL